MTTTIATTAATSSATSPSALAPSIATTSAPGTPGVPLAHASTWAHVTDGLWVASCEGEFRGTVEFVDGRFEAADERGTALGRSHSLAGAKRLVDQPTTPDPENVLGWSHERTVIALGWLSFGISAIAAVAIGSQLFM
jgi:hypothetical protein